MTDVVGANRLLLLWVPKKFSRWKSVSWGFCLGRLWVQWTPPYERVITQFPSVTRMGNSFYDATSQLWNENVDPIALTNIESYVKELEGWCGVDRSVISSCSGKCLHLTKKTNEKQTE